ncbi:YbjN domain-containing protein [Pseudohalioglobus lutimaris]|uniref:YbjN domain-containing protein n=1 Tax=Pseudohalioglobus lutimaris TaxID=1737061 RepID=A0A2N5X379_9GAMM|nr:YbjN domain-containing protein [Pseudohalioglobus lutimaris]PLW68939.1 YbjN domain-containing protein [Pseudohalioglobus lutimaris]
MSSPQLLDRATLESWLAEARVDFYTCGRCEGLHLRALQEMEGVIDSRLFLEPWGLLLTTELEIRPMALLPLAADLGRLNMDYPTLKLFQDVVDDATPQLVAAGTQLGGAGVTLEQFAGFVANTVSATRQVGAECLQLNYLFAEAGADVQSGSNALH